MNKKNKTKEGKSKTNAWREWTEAFAVALVLALLARTWVVQAFKIPSESMKKTLWIGDHILVNKAVYQFSSPKRGDVVIFKFPKDPAKDYVKRCIGRPGERVAVYGKTVYIDGKPIKEPYTYHDPRSFPRGYREPLPLKDGNYFMMGDNRNNSDDSRRWGSLGREFIKGKALWIYWPPITRQDGRWRWNWKKVR